MDQVMIQIVCYTKLTLQVEIVIKMSSNRTRPRIVLLSQTAAMFEWGNTAATTRIKFCLLCAAQQYFLLFLCFYTAPL